MRWLWVSLGLMSLAAGTIGIFLPLLPTVPFMLLAAFCFARSSTRLHDWLVSHPTFGPPIRDWRNHGAISRRAKILATISIAAALGLSIALDLRQAILLVQALVLLAVLVFIWSRPNP